LRFRLAPSGWLLGLPKYNRPPITILPHDDDGSLSITVSPVPVPRARQHPLVRLCRLNEMNIAVRRTFRLTADGKRLVMVGDIQGDHRMSAIWIWDLSGLHEAAREKAPHLRKAEREELWEQVFADFPDIGNPSCGIEVYRDFCEHIQGSSQQAMLSLVANPKDAVAWLRSRMGPPLEREHVPRLLKQLESRKFTEREAAARTLHQWAPIIRPALEAELAKEPPPDKKKRLQEMLNHAKSTAVSRELRALRIIDVLEHIPTTAARDLLKLLADGRYGDIYVEEAKTALQRCRPRP
jgi:hypothetical protein